MFLNILKTPLSKHLLRIRATEPGKYPFPMPGEDLYDYSFRQIRNIEKKWSSSGPNLHLSKNISFPFDTRITHRNCNTAVFSASPEEEVSFIKSQLFSSDVNFVVPDPSGIILNDCRSHLESNGYNIVVVSDPLQSLDDVLDQAEKFAVFYNITNDPKDKLYSVDPQKHWWNPAEFESSQDVFFSNIMAFLYSNHEKKGYTPRNCRHTLIFFSALSDNKHPCLDRWLATCRPYSIHFVLFIPSLEQVRNTYPKTVNEIYGNCDLHIFFNPIDEEIKRSIWYIPGCLMPEHTLSQGGGSLYRFDKSIDKYVKAKDLSEKHVNITISNEVFTQLENIKSNECLVFVRGLFFILDNKSANE